MAHCQQLDQDDVEAGYLEKGAYLLGATKNDKRTLRRLTTNFFLSGAILYKRSVDWMLLRYVDEQEAKGIMEEVHEGTFSTHTNGHALAHKILKAGYYWTKMESDCCQHVKRCVKCHVYVDNIHVAPFDLHNITSLWPFAMWGLDMIVRRSHVLRQCNKKRSGQVHQNGHHLMAHIITNNGTNLNNKMMIELCEQFKIKHHNSTPYCPKMNGVVEAANKNIKKIVVTYKD
ncbi:hypothetical protein CR513_52063, partial [Mucuna pruriens]